MLNPEHFDKEQTRCLERMIAPSCGNVFICWWKPGTGKTRLGLGAFENSGFHDLLLVVRRVSFGDWIDEMEKIGLDYTVYENDYSPKSIRRLSRAKGSKRVLLISTGDLKSIPERFPKGEFLLVDELYLFSNPKAKRSLLLQKISLFCSARVGLSGTIMPSQDNITIFGQCMALQAHRILAPTSSKFRGRFQNPARGRHGREYLMKPSAKAEIAKLLAPMVDIYMPPNRPTRIQILACDKTPEQAKAIKELETTYEYKEKEYKYALQIVNVVNGISNGWWVNSNGMVQISGSSKLERLLSLLDELLAGGESVVVWCAYHNDITRIAAQLGHKYCKFTGQDEFDEVGWKKGEYQICLATEAMGASVNYFGQVKYAIYYSINFKLLDLQQSMARHERKDSLHDGTHYYFLQTRGTYDARAYYLVTKSDLEEKKIIETLKNERIE